MCLLLSGNNWLIITHKHFLNVFECVIFVETLLEGTVLF